MRNSEPIHDCEAERVIDSWSMTYQSPKGFKYKGTLTITNKRLLYIPHDKHQTHQLEEEEFYKNWPILGNRIVIPKSRIKLIQGNRHFLLNTVIVILDNNSQHVFSKYYSKLGPILSAFTT